jgi:hypothetical protein
VYIAYNGDIIGSSTNLSKLTVAQSVDGITWTTTIVDSTSATGLSPSISIDSSNKLHIAYYYAVSTGGLKYATNASGSWVVSNVKIGSNKVSGSFNSILTLTDGSKNVLFYDPDGYTTNSDGNYEQNENGTLKFAKSSSWSSYVTVDSTAYTGKSVSTATDGTNIYVAYGFYNRLTGDNKLKFAKSINGGSNFTVSATEIDTALPITSGGDGIGYLNSALTYDTSSSTLYLIYVASSGEALKFASSTNGGTTWSKKTL